MECQMTIISIEMMKWVRTVPRPALKTNAMQ